MAEIERAAALLRHEDSTVRHKAIMYLAKSEDRQAIRYLNWAVQNDTDEELRTLAEKASRYLQRSAPEAQSNTLQNQSVDGGKKPRPKNKVSRTTAVFTASPVSEDDLTSDELPDWLKDVMVTTQEITAIPTDTLEAKPTVDANRPQLKKLVTGIHRAAAIDPTSTNTTPSAPDRKKRPQLKKLVTGMHRAADVDPTSTNTTPSVPDRKNRPQLKKLVTGMHQAAAVDPTSTNTTPSVPDKKDRPQLKKLVTGIHRTADVDSEDTNSMPSVSSDDLASARGNPEANDEIPWLKKLITGTHEAATVQRNNTNTTPAVTPDDLFEDAESDTRDTTSTQTDSASNWNVPVIPKRRTATQTQPVTLDELFSDESEAIDDSHGRVYHVKDQSIIALFTDMPDDAPSVKPLKKRKR